MIGVRTRRIASQFAVRSCFSIVTGVAAMKVSLMSAPAAKARSLPVRTMQRIASSSSSAERTATSSFMSSSFSAFNTSGRLSWTTAIASSRVTTTVFGMATSRAGECAVSHRSAQVAERAGQRGHLVSRGAPARVG